MRINEIDNNKIIKEVSKELNIDDKIVKDIIKLEFKNIRDYFKVEYDKTYLLPYIGKLTNRKHFIVKRKGIIKKLT